MPPTCGSPGSRDAPTLDPLVEPLAPEIVCAFATPSFAGASVAGCHVSVNAPGVLVQEFGCTSIQYETPCVTPIRPGSCHQPPAWRVAKLLPTPTATAAGYCRAGTVKR